MGNPLVISFVSAALPFSSVFLSLHNGLHVNKCAVPPEEGRKDSVLSLGSSLHLQEAIQTVCFSCSLCWGRGREFVVEYSDFLRLRHMYLECSTDWSANLTILPPCPVLFRWGSRDSIQWAFDTCQTHVNWVLPNTPWILVFLSIKHKGWTGQSWIILLPLNSLNVWFYGSSLRIYLWKEEGLCENIESISQG